MNDRKRYLLFEGCYNFRDLGGYEGRDGRVVRSRYLFRSMTPEYMTEGDAGRLASLSLGLVVDFRGPGHSSGPVAGAARRRLALGPDFRQERPPSLQALMTAAPQDALPALLELYGPYFARAMEALSEEREGATLFHCRLGKDRTGVFSALLLKLLGVSDEDVIEDYLLTRRHEARVRELLDRHRQTPVGPEPRVAREPASLEAIEAVVQLLPSRYGGAYGYFARHGVSNATLDRFIQSKLEAPSPGPYAAALAATA